MCGKKIEFYRNGYLCWECDRVLQQQREETAKMQRKLMLEQERERLRTDAILRARASSADGRAAPPGHRETPRSEPELSGSTTQGGAQNPMVPPQPAPATSEGTTPKVSAEQGTSEGSPKAKGRAAKNQDGRQRRRRPKQAGEDADIVEKYFPFGVGILVSIVISFVIASYWCFGGFGTDKEYFVQLFLTLSAVGGTVTVLLRIGKKNRGSARSRRRTGRSGRRDH
jgi:hypothetical protein